MPKVMITFHRVAEWFLAPLVDKWRGLSLTRLIAIFCCIAVGNDTFVQGHTLDWVDFAVLALAVAAAFGKLTYQAFLQRLTIGVSGSQRITETFTQHEWTTGDPDKGLL